MTECGLVKLKDWTYFLLHFIKCIKLPFTDMKQLSFFSLYHHRKMISLFIWSWLQCLQGCQIIFSVQTYQWLDFGVFTNTLKVFRTACPFTAPSKHNQTGISKVPKTFTDFCPLSVSNSRKMFSNWFQTLIILWKAALGQRLNSLKAKG